MFLFYLVLLNIYIFRFIGVTKYLLVMFKLFLFEVLINVFTFVE